MEHRASCKYLKQQRLANQKLPSYSIPYSTSQNAHPRDPVDSEESLIGASTSEKFYSHLLSGCIVQMICIIN